LIKLLDDPTGSPPEFHFRVDDEGLDIIPPLLIPPSPISSRSPPDFTV
jgi:hypothetical protein